MLGDIDHRTAILGQSRSRGVRDNTAITVAATDCNIHLFPTANTRYSACDRVSDFLTKRGLSFESLESVAGQAVVTRIGDTELAGWEPPKGAHRRPGPRHPAWSVFTLCNARTPRGDTARTERHRRIRRLVRNR